MEFGVDSRGWRQAGSANLKYVAALGQINPFDAHCYHIGTAIKHPVPDRVKPSFVIFDIRAL